MMNRFEETAYRSARTRQSGATLIEVLVTVAVTSIGLLGMAGLMLVSQRVNHEAYLRTQVNFIAQSMIDSMHINGSAVAEGAYNGTYVGASMSGPECETHGCTPAQRAEYDRMRFDRALRTLLPNATAALQCTNGGQPAVPPAVVYDGLCRLEIGWAGRALSAGSEDAGQSSLVWMFQP